MSGIVRRMQVEGRRGTRPFGPWAFDRTSVQSEFVATDVEVGALSAAQLIGGVAPLFSMLTQVTYLLIVPPVDILLGVQGLTAQTQGLTVSADEPFTMSGGLLTEVQVYNPDAAAALLFVVLGGS